METNQNAKFKVRFYKSNGFGELSSEDEWFVDVNELKNIFNGKLVEYVEKWLSGESFSEVIFSPQDNEDEIMTIRTTTEGCLMVELEERNEAAGYSDAPVCRFYSDIYVISYH